MPSRRRKQYYKKKGLDTKPAEEDQSMPEKEEKEYAPPNPWWSFILFLFAFIVTAGFIVIEQFVLGVVVSSVILFFAFRNLGSR